MPNCSTPNDLITELQQSRTHRKASAPVCLRAAYWDLLKGIKIQIWVLRTHSLRSQVNLGVCMTRLSSIYGYLCSAEQDLLQGDDTTSPPLPRDQPLQSVLDLKITDLLGFLHQYEASCPNLQMTCPLFGIPLPSIDIELDSSLKMSAKIEFSLPLSEALVRRMLVSRAASTKVS